AREPNLFKAVEQVRQHIVDAPEMDREVAEKVNRALREVVQLQQQGREVEARVRLTQALDQAEEALRGNGGKSQPSQNLVELVKDVRSQVMKESDLTKALVHVRTQLVHNDNVPVEVQQKMEKAIKDASLLQQIGRETFAKNHLIRALEQIEKAAAAKEQKPQTDLLETIQQIKQTIAKAETIEAAIREIRQHLHRFSDNSIVTQLTKAMFEAAKLDKSGREQLLTSLTNLESKLMRDITSEKEISNQHVYDAVRKAIKTLQREANLEKAIDFIKTETMPRLNKEPELGKKLTDSFTKALQLKENGRELAARQTMLETLTEIETSLPPAVNDETDPSTSLDKLFDSEWQTSIPLQTKDVIVQTITKKMSQAAIDFKNIKRDIMRNLETISQLIEKYRQSAQPQAKQLLETTIKQLDNAILKSDMMLFTDMTTEKQLMKASSQLAEARKRLNKGDYSGAQKIVKEVKDVLEKIKFKPSDVKVKHFVADESLKFAGSPKEFLTHMNKTVQPVALEPSARQMFETIRRLGLTHDYEVAESLVFKGNKEEAPQQNMKAMFLKLAQSGNEQVAQQAEQALNNLTGQQLLNKFDAGANVQSFFFTLPLLLQNEVRSIKVYVNSRKDGERIDWENCSLYFLLETKKLGDVGVLLNANERNLSLTFRNNREDFAEKMLPLVETAREKLEEIGYRVGSVQFTTFAEKQEETPAVNTKRATFTEKGYDFTI
ncbi:metal-dependent peptidase, partial [Thermolongibacillus altinsuensis]